MVYLIERACCRKGLADGGILVNNTREAILDQSGISFLVNIDGLEGISTIDPEVPMTELVSVGLCVGAGGKRT